MRAARSSVVIAGRVARGREGRRRGLGDVGLPEARGGRAGCGATKMAARQRARMRGRLGEGFLNAACISNRRGSNLLRSTFTQR